MARLFQQMRIEKKTIKCEIVHQNYFCSLKYAHKFGNILE